MSVIAEEIHSCCPVCGNKGKKCGEQEALAFYHRCRHCDTVWLSDRSQYNKSGKSIYDEEYVAKMDAPEGIRGYRRLAERHFCLLHFIASAMGKRNPEHFRFAEIGFSLPSIIRYFYDYGYDVTALDIKIPQQRRKDFSTLVDTGRLHFVESDFESWKTDEKFDVLWMSHVLEHLEDTLSSLKKIKGLLKSTGVAFISSPDAENMKDRGVQGLIGHMHPKEHLFMYSLATFAKLCSKTGLKVCFWERYGDPMPGQFEFVTKMEWRALVVPEERDLV